VDVVPGFGGDRHQLQVVELARQTKQHPALVRGAACRRLRRPRRILQRDRKLLGVRGLVRLPCCHGVCEVELGKRGAEPHLQCTAQCRAVERQRCIALVRVDRLALDELAANGEQRRQLVVAGFERAHVGADAEQLRDEILDMRRDGDQQLGFCLAWQCIGADPCGQQPVGQHRIGRAQVIDEQRIDTCRTRDGVEVGERDAVGERKHQVTGKVRRRVHETWDFTVPDVSAVSTSQA
jgi:hypothetical protein